MLDIDRCFLAGEQLRRLDIILEPREMKLPAPWPLKYGQMEFIAPGSG